MLENLILSVALQWVKPTTEEYQIDYYNIQHVQQILPDYIDSIEEVENACIIC